MISSLRCGIQNYAWGKPGSQGEVAQLGVSGGHLNETDNDKPYAELWMGSHVNCPSKLADGKLLSDWLKEHGSCDGQLTFLFKVLSVQTALSVQVHPNKEEAVKLHAARPDLYKDPNHKPEMAIALTPFEMMAFFRPAKKVAEFCKEYAPLAKLLGNDTVEELEKNSNVGAALKTAYTKLFRSNEEDVKVALNDLVAQISVQGRSLSKLHNHNLYFFHSFWYSFHRRIDSTIESTISWRCRMLQSFLPQPYDVEPRRSRIFRSKHAPCLYFR